MTINPGDPGFIWRSARPVRQCELPHRRIKPSRLKVEWIVMPPVKSGHARDFGGEPWKKALPTKAALRRSGLRSRNYRRSHGSVPPYFCVPGLRSRRSLPRHSVALASEEAGGPGGLMHHGFGGGFGTGRGSGPPGFMSHGGPGFAGRGFQGGSPWGQPRGQSQFRQRASSRSPTGGGQQNYGHWPNHGQPSQVGTRELPGRGNCRGGPCRPD